MKELIITPQLAFDACLRNKPSILTISKVSIVFNAPAVKRLALKPGIRFQLILKDSKLLFKEVAAKSNNILDSESFEIKTVDYKSARLNNHGVYILLQENVKNTEKTMRFEICDFKEGFRELKIIS